MMEQLNELISAHAGALWVLPVVFLLCGFDGFFPPLPSESLVVALAAISASQGSPNLLVLGVVAAAGAFVGDQFAYWLGAKSGLGKLRHSKKRRLRAAFRWAERELDRRGTIIIFVARYIPVGRLAVNLTAGASHFSWRRFTITDTCAVITWSVYSIAIGAGAGTLIKGNPLLGSIVGICFAVITGFLIDRVLQRFGATPSDDSDDDSPQVAGHDGASSGS